MPIPRFHTRTSRSLRVWLLCGLIFAASFSVGASQPVTLRAAVAANFRLTFEQLLQAWGQQERYRVQMISGSSGQLYAQIRHGAPFDIFFSADRARPLQLQAHGLATAGKLRDYAEGVLMLARPKSSTPWQQHIAQGNGRIALANPRTAPYGMAAQAVLNAQGLDQALAARLVFPESVQQVLHYLVSQQAQFGFVSAAQAHQLGTRYQVLPMPADHYPPILQAAVIPLAARQPQAAEALLEFVLSPDGQSIIEAAGYRRVVQ